MSSPAAHRTQPRRAPSLRGTLRISIDDLAVIVPTKNEADNIGEFLTAVPDELELIVVDSSTDETPRVIEAVRPSTTIVRADVNIPAARQIGGRAARGDWLLFTDADVAFAPDYFERLGALDLPASTGGVVGVKSTVDGFDFYHRWFRRGQQALTTLGIPAATGSNMLVSRRALDHVGGFDPALSVNEDTELMFRIRRAGFAVVFGQHLVVRSFDHRRLEAGLARKVLHGAVRNTALYLGLFPERVRRSDWGYWKTTRPDTGMSVAP